MKDALLVLDVFNDFEHEDGEALCNSFRERVPAMADALATARGNGTPIVFVNDQRAWDSNAPALVRAAIEAMPQLAPLEPQGGEAFVLKPRYSAFDHTPLVLLLRELDVERVLLAGASTEGCVVQSGIDARELGFKVTILADACATTDPE